LAIQIMYDDDYKNDLYKKMNRNDSFFSILFV